MPAVNAGRQKTSAGTVSPPFRPAPDLTEAPLSDFAVSLRSLENAAYTSYPSATLIAVMEGELKALLPMEVTLAGMVTEVRLVQPLKALLPMEVTLAGIVTVVRGRGGRR